MRYLSFLFLFVVLIHIDIKAHPHVFIETNITICFNHDNIDKLLICFDFDQMFSADIKQTFDKNNNAIFEPDEIEEIRKNAFSNLVNYNYFIHVIDGGSKLKIDSISDFKASINTKGKLQYFFTINTNINTVTPNKKIRIAAFDHSYFIDVALHEKGIKFINNSKVDYSWKLVEDKNMAYYYGQIYPSTVVLSFN
ncbi:MAG: DUF1007 family protein [Salinivirgaceae bacterium]|nr:DUF1007 family protein [Salinivirgaceae bacterium]